MIAGRRDQLASALVVAAASTGSYEAHDLADALLAPGGFVDRMIRQAQAEALDDVRFFMRRNGSAGESVYVEMLNRAAALRVTTDHPDVTQDGP